MSEIAPTVATITTSAEAEETRSVVATYIGQLIAILRQLVQFILNICSRVFSFASEHPLALTLLVTNIMIWVS